MISNIGATPNIRAFETMEARLEQNCVKGHELFHQNQALKKAEEAGAGLREPA